jgi:hypothetical protein
MAGTLDVNELGLIWVSFAFVDVGQPRRVDDNIRPSFGDDASDRFTIGNIRLNLACAFDADWMG